MSILSSRRLLFLLWVFLFLVNLQAQNVELIIPSGHSNFINSIATSPDGKFVATCGFDRQVILWERSTGTQLKVFAQAGEDMAVAAFSPDSKMLAIGTTVRSGFSIQVYEVATSKPVYSTGDGVRATGLYFSKDGTYLVASGWGKSLVFFEAGSGKEIKAIKWSNKDGGSRNQDYRVNNLAVAPDEKYLALSASDYTVGIFENPFGKIKSGGNQAVDYVFGGFSGEVNYCHWSKDGKFLFAQDGSGDVKAWSLATKQVLWSSKKMPKHSIYSLRMTPDGRRLTLLSGNIFYEYDLPTGNELSQKVEDVLPPGDYWQAESEELYLAATGKYGEALAVVDLRTKSVMVEMRGKSDNGLSVTASKSGWLLGSFDGFQPKIWNLQSGQIKTLPNVTDSRYLALNASASQALLSDGIFELKTGRKIQSLALNPNRNNRAVFDWSADGKFVVHMEKDSDGRFQILNLESGKSFTKNASDAVIIGSRAATFSPDSLFVALGWNDGEVQIVKTDSGETIKTFTVKGEGGYASIDDCQFSPDGKMLYVFSGGIPISYNTSNWTKQVKFASYKNWQGRKLSVSPDGQFLLASYGGFNSQKCDVVMFDAKTGKQLRIFNGHSNTVRTVSWLADGKHFVSSGLDHTIRVWNKDQDIELFKLFSFENSKDWVAVTPDGHFDGTQKGMEKLYFVRDMISIPLASLFEKYYVPGLVMKQLGGKTVPPAPEEDVNKLKAPPLVKIGVPTGQRNLTVEDEKSAARRYQIAEEEISLTVEAQCPDDGISEIRLYQNGKLVGGGTRNLTVENDTLEKTKSQKFELTLGSGDNEFKAIALNSQRTESQPDEIIVTSKPAKSVIPASVEANLYLVVIGINQYKNQKYNLNYATADATAFKSMMERSSVGLYAKINATYLGDAQATKAGIAAEMDRIKALAQPRDVFIFYFAGHGVMNDKKEFYLVPSDVTQLYGADDVLAQKGVSAILMQQYSKEIKAQKQLFILDACQSAGALENVVAARGAAEEKAIAQLARATGTHWLTASGTEQFASEFKQLGHGTFTYVLLEAMTGKADQVNDRKITVKELDAYLQELVPELTAKYRGTPQYPASYGYGNDFPIGIVK